MRKRPIAKRVNVNQEEFDFIKELTKVSGNSFGSLVLYCLYEYAEKHHPEVLKKLIKPELRPKTFA